MTKRLVIVSALLLILVGLVVAAVGVHLLAGPAAGLIADGVAVAVVGVAVVALWA